MAADIDTRCCCNSLLLACAQTCAHLCHASDGAHSSLRVVCLFACLFVCLCGGWPSYRLNAYLDFVAAKARGDLMTTAQWMRKFIQGHPHYQRDSVVTDEISFDLLKRMQDISEGLLKGFSVLEGHRYTRREAQGKAQAQRERERRTDTHTQTQTHTQTHTHRHRHTRTHTHRHTDTQTHTHTCTVQFTTITPLGGHAGLPQHPCNPPPSGSLDCCWSSLT